MDEIPVLIQQDVCPCGCKTDKLWICGHIYSGHGAHGELTHYVYAEHIAEQFEGDDVNSIELTGYVCNEPVYRRTPHGREITELFLAVKNEEGEADYIPCIAWGKKARRAKKLNVGDCIHLTGRIQSRKYTKDNYQRQVCEVSITEFERESEHK